jgi:tetratricopeptide (TPR) repeat protein
MPEPATFRPLALHPLITAYRKVPAPQVRDIPGPLRIVVAIAAPSRGGGPLLDYERELRNVLSAVRAARQGDADVRVVPFATTAAIRAALDESPAHVLHLSCHGGPGTLELEDDEGSARMVTAEELIEEAIPPSHMPPVFCLSACYTDTPAAEGAPSFASELIQRGASVVVGTETSVTDWYATSLFARIYQELTQSAEPDVVSAVADARRLVQRHLSSSDHPRDAMLANLDEWSVVTVLAGTGSTRVFDPTDKAPVPERRHSSIAGLLSRDTGEFVGRRREQRELPILLASSKVSGTVLHGIGGVGKTTLASELIRRLNPPVLVVLGGELSVDAVLSKVASTLRRHLEEGPVMRAVQFANRVDEPWQDRFDALRDHVLDRLPLLLVLDNFEDNLTDNRQLRGEALAALLTRWATDPGASRLLITSRYQFTLPTQAESHLRFHLIGPLSMAETFKLIWSLPTLDRMEEAQLERIWRLVGGHPRSLEYLDALLNHGKARYHDVTARLTNAAQDFPEGQRALTAKNLDAALAQTLTLIADDVLLDELLTRLAAIPGAQDVLLGASVYREPVDINALLFQVGVSDESAAYIPDWQSAKQRILADHGITADELARPDELPPDTYAQIQPVMIELFGQIRPPRSTPLDLPWLIHQVAATSLLIVDPDASLIFVHRWTASELERRWRDRGQNYELRQAHSRAAQYWQWWAATWQNRDGALHGMLEARYHMLAAGDVEKVEGVTHWICERLRDVGAWDFEANLIHETLDRLNQDSSSRAIWLDRLGVLAQHRGDWAEAEHHYRQCLIAFDELGDLTGVAIGYEHLGILAQLRSDYVEAGRCFRRALTIHEELGSRADMAATYDSLGDLANEVDDYVEAERCFLRTLAIFEELGSRADIAETYNSLGDLAENRADYSAAEYWYQQALNINYELDSQVGIATSYSQLAGLARERGDHAGARRLYRCALTVYEKLGSREQIAHIYHLLGILAHARGDHVDAQRCYEESLIIDEELGSRPGMALTYYQLGQLVQDLGDYAEAERRYIQALTIKEELGDREGIVTACCSLGGVAEARGQLSEAVVWHTRAFSFRANHKMSQLKDDLPALAGLRRRLGVAFFVEAAATIADGDTITAIISWIDEFESQLGEEGRPSGGRGV